MLCGKLEKVLFCSNPKEASTEEQDQTGIPHEVSLSFPSFLVRNPTLEPQLEKTHETNPSSPDEALAHYSVSREVPRSVLKYQTVPGTLDVTPKIPRQTGFTPGEHQGFRHHFI